MNGFLLVNPGPQRAQPWDRCATPPAAGITVQRTLLAAGDLLFAWGYAGGDIHSAESGKSSFLLLSGYLTEIKGQPGFTTQAQATELLLRCLDEDCSHPALSALLDRCYGSFGIYYRNVPKGISLCISDRVASRPLWTFWAGSGWLVSSHPSAIVASLPNAPVDPGALAAFLLYGGPVDPSKSLVEGLRALPPGSVVNLQPQGTREPTRWYRFQHRPDDRVSLQGWIDLASERLTHAGARLTKTCKNPAVLLSGGTDSRLIATALHASGAKPSLLTLGDGWNLETRVARQVAKTLGLRHQLIRRDRHYYLRSLPRGVYEGDGTLLWVHAHYSEAMRQCVEEAATDAFLLGDFGEAFSKLLCEPVGETGKPLPPAQFADAFDTLRPAWYRPTNREATLSLLRPELRAEAEAALRRDILERYEEIRSASPDPLIVGDQFFRWDSVASMPTFLMVLDLRSAVPERNLMFDRDVHELLEVLPSRIRNGANFGALLIKKLNRRAAWVPSSNTLLPLFWPPAAHRFAKSCRPVLGKARRLLRGASYKTSGAWHIKSALYATDPEWRCYCEEILCDPQLFNGQIFSPGAVAASWRAFLAGETWRAADLEKLLHLGTMARAQVAGKP
jgi:hypothetical protein